jgi:chromosomal replication initiator protein
MVGLAAMALLYAEGRAKFMTIATSTVMSAGEDSATEIWERVQGRLRAEHGEATFRSWFKSLEFVGVRDGQAMMTVPTRFMREWLATHFLNDIQDFLHREDPRIRSVDIFVKPVAFKPATAVDLHDAPSPRAAANEVASVVSAPTAPASAANAPLSTSQDDLCQATLDPRFTFDNFIVGKPNELAHAAARRVAESTEVTPGCNPLFIYGGVGLGKTHLMHAIAWHIRLNNPERKVLYLSAEKFMYEFIRSLREKNTISFKEQFRSVDVLMVDDVQFISGKDSTQEEFFHTFNALVDQNKQVVISGDRSPSDLDGIEERMRSRLGWGLVADVHSTSYELRMGILQAKAEHLPVDVPSSVLEFLAHKITSNVRELEGALNRVVAHATLVGQELTLETTHQVLRDLVRANDRRVTVEDIQKKVAEHFNIKVSDMFSARRSRVVARPRQIAMCLAKRLTTHSLPEIGRKFGGKDHTTVMHAVRRVEELCANDNSVAEDVELLTRMLQN